MKILIILFSIFCFSCKSQSLSKEIDLQKQIPQDLIIDKIEKLKKEGKMYPAGLAAFAKLDPNNIKKAVHEKENPLKLSAAYLKQVKANKKAWIFFDSLAPSYKKATEDWVMQAKKEATRLRRLDVLISSAENGQKIPNLRKR